MNSYRRYVAPLTGVVAAIVYGVITRFILGQASEIFGSLSLSFLIFTPLALGMLAFAFAEDKQKNEFRSVITLPWLASGICMVVSVLFVLEAWFCVCLISPYVFGASTVGALLAKGIWHLTQSSRNRASAVALFALMPFLFIPIERTLPLQSAIRTVESQIVIAATPEIVWQNITNLDPIVGAEQHETFFHVLGLPRPHEARMVCQRVGCLRRGEWEDGLAFNGVITAIEPGVYYKVALDADTSHVHSSLAPLRGIGGPVFGMVDDSYRLETTAGGRTILHLYSTYRVKTRINAYAIFWLDLLMRDIQGYILGVEKSRAEMNGAQP